jgi:hypothetical protein
MARKQQRIVVVVTPAGLVDMAYLLEQEGDDAAIAAGVRDIERIAGLRKCTVEVRTPFAGGPLTADQIAFRIGADIDEAKDDEYWDAVGTDEPGQEQASEP